MMVLPAAVDTRFETVTVLLAPLIFSWLPEVAAMPTTMLLLTNVPPLLTTKPLLLAAPKEPMVVVAMLVTTAPPVKPLPSTVNWFLISLPLSPILRLWEARSHLDVAVPPATMLVVLSVLKVMALLVQSWPPLVMII